MPHDPLLQLDPVLDPLSEIVLPNFSNKFVLQEPLKTMGAMGLRLTYPAII